MDERKYIKSYRDDAVALGRQAMTSKHWKWMPGMLTTGEIRIVEASDFRLVGAYENYDFDWEVIEIDEVNGAYQCDWVPDFFDQTTVDLFHFTVLRVAGESAYVSASRALGGRIAIETLVRLLVEAP